MPPNDAHHTSAMLCKKKFICAHCGLERKASPQWPLPALAKWDADRANWNHYCADDDAACFRFYVNTYCQEVMNVNMGTIRIERDVIIQKEKERSVAAAPPAKATRTFSNLFGLLGSRQAASTNVLLQESIPLQTSATPADLTGVDTAGQRNSETISQASGAGELLLGEPPAAVPTAVEITQADREVSAVSNIFLTPDQEKLELGRPLWKDVEGKVPRGTHEGSLKIVRANTPVGPSELRSFLSEYPDFPFITPPPPEARARVLLQSKGVNGVWTTELKAEARCFFEAHAAGLRMLAVFPEVFARDELMGDPRFQVPSMLAHRMVS